ncbi:MAG: hypothetical protein ACI9FR_001790 [Cryomorphaceae bacterium]
MVGNGAVTKIGSFVAGNKNNISVLSSMFQSTKLIVALRLQRQCSLQRRPSQYLPRSFFGKAFRTPFAVAVSLLVAFQANAEPIERDKLMAVMSVINNNLLSGRQEPEPEPSGMRVSIEMNELIEPPQAVTEGNQVYAAFDLQEEDVEFCFDLAMVAQGGIAVQVNGSDVEAFGGTDNCYVIPEHLQRLINYITISAIGSGADFNASRLELAPSKQYRNELPILTRGGWDERAVRKVLKIFAFGGHATTEQIIVWADMNPELAIVEMLHFGEHNDKLSPLAIGEIYTDSATQHGTLQEWIAFISNDASNLPIPTGTSRENFGLNKSNFDDGYNRMITVRGLNPFRQRIGFWETNYHLAVNLDAGVSRSQVARYYDIIMQAHEAGLPYHEIMGVAAKSAAAAEQYGHDRNQWRSVGGEFICQCNDDFAREIHQLFYGIFGEDDPNHEDVTIPQTARLLTDMPLENSDGPDDDLVVVFGTARHHVAAVNVLGVSIAGADAEAKINALMPISMAHPESLKNLPVMIISVLADDNLSESSKTMLRLSWAALGPNKNFLEFIQSYAVSTLLHGRQHRKYLTSHERALYQANKNNLDNLEAYFGGGSYDGRAGRSVGGSISDDNAGDFFRPAHNVFGGQTGLEAAESSLVFENNFNVLTDDEYRMRDAVACKTCDQGQPWEKKWQTVLPQRAPGEFYVADVAPWLWNHAVGDMENYTELERAHLYSMLGAALFDPEDDNDGDYGHDFNLIMCIIEDYQLQEQATDAPILEILTNRDALGNYDGSWNDYCDDNGGDYEPHEVAILNRVYTGQEIADSPTIQDVLNQLGQVKIRLNATESYSLEDAGATVRKHARERVNSALGFIFTTPFIFAEGQQ